MEYVKIREKIPFLGKGVESVLAAMKHILSSNPYAQKIIFEVGKPILLEKMVPKEEVPESVTVSYYDAIRTNPMYEHLLEEGKSPFQHLYDMALVIYNEGMEPCHLLVGDKHAFQKWLRVTIPVTHMFVFGVPLKILPELEADVFILCGAENRDSGPEDILFSVKGSLP